MPLFLKPPKGLLKSSSIGVFTVMVPLRMRVAISTPCSVSPHQTPPPRPKSESFAIATACSSPSQGITTSTGPKISSRAIDIPLSTS